MNKDDPIHPSQKKSSPKETTDPESLVLSDQGGRFLYARSANPYSIAIASSLKSAYGRDAFVCSSGMNAIYSTMAQLAAPDCSVVYSSELYTDTPKVLKHFADKFKMPLHCVDVRDPASIQKLFEKEMNDRAVILFTESCSNPNSYVFDFSLVPALRKSCRSLRLVVDNTWLTDLIFNPFEHGADIVVVSLTKYYGGGVAIGGAVIGPSAFIELVSEASRIMGQHVSPHNCRLIAEGMQSMQKRVVASSALTRKLVSHLASATRVPITHPSLTSHPSHELAKRYFKNDLFPSVFTFGVKGSKNNALRAMKTSSIEHKTSFGSMKTRSDPWPHKEGDLIVCRIAVGFDDEFERVVKGFMEILKAV